MSRNHCFVLGIACAVCLAIPNVALSDFYDSFNDGWYERDPNDPRYDANDPYWTDPNNAVLFDIDNPDWNVYVPLGTAAAVTAQEGWLRLWGADTFSPWALTVAYVDDGDLDPETSVTYWDDTTTHYILARIKNFDDPNTHRGRATLFLNVNEFTWTGGYEVTYEFYKSPNRLWGIDCVTGMWWTGITHKYVTPMAGESTGFWMLFQFKSDGNGGDPNGKYLQATCWDGDKYAWDGTWVDNVHLAADPNTWYDPNAALFYDDIGGRTAIASYGDIYWHGPNGYPSDVGFDGIEMRTGAFDPNNPRMLNLTVSNSHMGTIKIDPDILADCNNVDPNLWDPTDYSAPRRYTDGTTVVLTAEPLSGKSLKQWTIYDPNHPGDANYTVQDTNTVLYLTMDADWEIEAKFKCGGGVPPFIAMTLLALALGVVLRRAT